MKDIRKKAKLENEWDEKNQNMIATEKDAEKKDARKCRVSRELIVMRTCV